MASLGGYGHFVIGIDCNYSGRQEAFGVLRYLSWPDSFLRFIYARYSGIDPMGRRREVYGRFQPVGGVPSAYLWRCSPMDRDAGQCRCLSPIWLLPFGVLVLNEKPYPSPLARFCCPMFFLLLAVHRVSSINSPLGGV